MQLNAVSLNPGGAVQSLVGIRTIATPAVGEPRRFHLPLYLRFTTGGADQIAVRGGETKLQGAFLPLDYDALQPPQSSLAASLADLGQAVVVTLDAPRRVRSIRLTAAAPATGQTIDLCRLDGNAIAEKPTVSAALQGQGQNRIATIPDTADFTDLRFALRLRNAGGDLLDLNPAHIAAVGVRAYAATPRLGIAPADALHETTSVATLPGEIGKSESDGTFDLGTALASALQQHFDALRAAAPDAPLADPLDVALVVASDAPCRIDVDAFAIAARLVRASFAPPAEKVSLRFAGGQAKPQSVAIALPMGATVHAASMRAVESFGRDRVPAANSHDPTAEVLQGSAGITVDTTRWTVQEIAAPEAITTTGVALGLMPLVEKTSLQLEIQEDWQGSPSGKRMAAGSIVLDRLGSAAWVTLQFPDQITLPTRPHWLMTRAAIGLAVWLTQPQADSTRLGRLDGSTLIPLTGVEARYQLIVPASIAQSAAQVSTLTVGASVLRSVPGSDGEIHYDLTTALNAALHVQDAAGEGHMTIPLIVTSALSGFVTIYPPHVEFDP